MSLVLWAATGAALFFGLALRLPAWKWSGLAIAAVVLSGVLSTLGTDRACADGWGSASIGRQGACSHHGGVTTVLNEFGWALMALSLPLGFVLYRKMDVNLQEAYVRERSDAAEARLSARTRLEDLVERLNRRAYASADAVQETIALASACASERVPIAFEYTDNAGYSTHRMVTPIRVYRSGRTDYLSGYCHLRCAERTFSIRYMTGVARHGVL